MDDASESVPIDFSMLRNKFIEEVDLSITENIEIKQ